VRAIKKKKSLAFKRRAFHSRRGGKRRNIRPGSAKGKRGEKEEK